MDNLQELLKTKSLRLTNARKQVYNILQASDRALAPKDIYSKISKSHKNTDLVSIYRNLSVFSELGIAHRLQDGRYSICKHEHEESSHIHLLISCNSCGKVEEIQSHSSNICKMVRELKSVAKGLHQVGSIQLQGLCKKCK